MRWRKVDATPREGHYRILQPSESTSPPHALRLILNKDHLLVVRVDLKRRFLSILCIAYYFYVSDNIWNEGGFDQRSASMGDHSRFASKVAIGKA